VAEPKHWLQEGAPEGIDAAADVDTIVSAISPNRLNAEHPLYRIWNEPSDRARDELHQLADDIRSVVDVPGAAGLLRAMRSDRDGYRDFRYELRIAANVARSPGQTVTHLGGQGTGPDIEFKSRSGHACGVACYSARSDPPYIGEIRDTARALTTEALKLFIPAGLLEVFGLVVDFDHPPVDAEQVRDTIWILHPLLTNHFVPPKATRGQVTINRVPAPGTLRLPRERRLTRIRYRFSLRELEHRRILRHVQQKIATEANRWAGKYQGVPIFAMEESDGAQAQFKTEAPGLLKGSPFVCTMVTSYTYGFLERIDWSFADHDRGFIDIGQQTFRESLNAWRGEDVTIELPLKYSTEDWDLFERPEGCGSFLVKSLTYGVMYHRIGHLPPGPNPGDDPAFRALIEAAYQRMNDEANSWPMVETRGQLPSKRMGL
jgi:hypothetical protein